MTDSSRENNNRCFKSKSKNNFFGKQYCGSFNTLQLMIEVGYIDGTTECNGVLYLTIASPSGTGFFKFKEGGYTRYTVIKIWTSTLIRVHKI